MSAATAPARAAPEIQRLPTEIPADLVAASGGGIELLLGYQKRLLETTAVSQVTVAEKSRRIGYTWGVASDAVLTAGAEKSAGGMDVLYIGYNLDMAREFIDTAGAWARLFDRACTTVQEFLFDDGDAEDGIKAFRITFASGFEIVALASRPRSLRGRQGYVIIDEAAFHDDLDELMKSALALLIWGGKVLIISTHDGADNPFNRLIEEVRAGRKPYALIRVTFDDALADGLYRRICLVTGKAWTAEGEKAWRQSIIDFYGDGADEELFCIPRNAGGAYLPRALIEARSSRDIPVLRWTVPESFVNEPEHITQAAARDWCQQHLKPLLSALDPALPSCLGQDFGRHGDLTVLWPLQIQRDLVRRTPFVVELRNVPFEEQKLIAFYIIDRLPRFVSGAFDAGGNGASQAEAARRRYGEHRIEEVKFSAEWYRVNMPRYKAAFEGGSILIPADIDVRADHEMIAMDRGVAKIPDKVRTTGADGGQRHGDSAIAGALAWYASEREVAEYGYTPASAAAPANRMVPRRGDDDPARSLADLQGAW